MTYLNGWLAVPCDKVQQTAPRVTLHEYTLVHIPFKQRRHIFEIVLTLPLP